MYCLRVSTVVVTKRLFKVVDQVRWNNNEISWRMQITSKHCYRHHNATYHDWRCASDDAFLAWNAFLPTLKPCGSVVALDAGMAILFVHVSAVHCVYWKLTAYAYNVFHASFKATPSICYRTELYWGWLMFEPPVRESQRKGGNMKSSVRDRGMM